MPNILFASNSVSHFPGTSVRNATWSYDANRVPYSIYTPPATMASTPIFPATTTGETWFHFRAGAEVFYTNNYEPIFEVVDIDGVRIGYMDVRDSTNYGYTMKFEAGAQSSSQSKWLPLLGSQMRTYDIRILYTGLIARMEAYVNEILILTSEFSVSEARVPRFLRLGGHRGQFDNQGAYYSEIIVADADTRNARLDLLRPIAAGVYGNWNGPLSSLADDDPTTGMTTTLPDQSQTTVLSAYGGANNISNIVQVTTTVRGINSPENLQHTIRVSGVDYHTANFAVPFNKEFQVTDWKLNPATSQPWAATDLVNSEFGFKSIA